MQRPTKVEIKEKFRDVNRMQMDILKNMEKKMDFLEQENFQFKLKSINRSDAQAQTESS